MSVSFYLIHTNYNIQKSNYQHDNRDQSVLLIYDYLFDAALCEHMKWGSCYLHVYAWSDPVPGGTRIITPLQELMEWAQAVVAAT